MKLVRYDGLMVELNLLPYKTSCNSLCNDLMKKPTSLQVYSCGNHDYKQTVNIPYSRLCLIKLGSFTNNHESVSSLNVSICIEKTIKSWLNARLKLLIYICLR